MKFLFHVDQVKVSWGSIYSNESLVARVSRVVAFSVKRVCHSECLATFIKLFSPQVTDFFSRTDDLFNEMIWQKKLRGKSFQVNPSPYCHSQDWRKTAVFENGGKGSHNM